MIVPDRCCLTNALRVADTLVRLAILEDKQGYQRELSIARHRSSSITVICVCDEFVTVGWRCEGEKSEPGL